jgi:hypothetical protein
VQEEQRRAHHQQKASGTAITLTITTAAHVHSSDETIELQARAWTVRTLPNKVFLRSAGDGRSHLYCGTTGQVGVTTSNPKEPNTWFLHLLPRLAPVVAAPTTPRYARAR